MTQQGGTRILTPALKKVTSAGTAEALPALTTSINAESGPAKTVMIQALSTNEGTIVVGDSNVKAAAGTHASPERRGISLAANATLSIEVVDVTKIFLDATTSGDGVTYMVLLA